MVAAPAVAVVVILLVLVAGVRRVRSHVFVVGVNGSVPPLDGGDSFRLAAVSSCYFTRTSVLTREHLLKAWELQTVDAAQRIGLVYAPS